MNYYGGKIKSFTDLHAWKEGHRLVLMIYESVKFFPKEELFGLVSQMKRSSVSVTSNISEGFSRSSYKDKLRFYFMSLSSISELQNQILIARDVGYITTKKFQELATQSIKVHKITNGLIKKTKTYIS